MKQNNSSRRAFGVAALAGGSLMLSASVYGQTAGKMLSKKALSALVASAKTAEDHRKLAAHYRAAAAQHEAEAKQHTELAAKYKANPTGTEQKHPNAPDTASHCLTYAEHCRNAAKVMSEMAAMHEEMAKHAK